jgi:alpha-tubulin suppressor-like RCC1 family protein
MLLSRRDVMTMLAAIPLASRARWHESRASGRRIVSAGLSTYLIEPDGTVKAWSLETPVGNYLGLGFRERVTPFTAYQIPGLRDVTDLAATDQFACALRSDGTLAAWGANARGQLGITKLSELEVTARWHDSPLVPTQVVEITDVAQIAAGTDHVLAVTRAGTAWAWGYNIGMQLGISPMPIIRFKTHTPAAMDYLPFPMPIPGLSDVAAVAGGFDHSMALMKDGTIRAWGTNKLGQLGDGTVVDRPTPVPVTGIRNAVAIAAASQVSAALLSDGTVMTWGLGNGALGRPAPKEEAPYPTPAVVPGVTGVRAIALGSEHMLALTATGSIVSWGDSRMGEVGHAGRTPQRIAGLTGVRSIAAHTGRSFCVLGDGTIMAWGHIPPRTGGGNAAEGSPSPIRLVVRNLTR